MKRDQYHAWKAAEAELQARLALLKETPPVPPLPPGLLNAYRRSFPTRRRKTATWWLMAAAAAVLLLAVWLRPAATPRPAAVATQERMTEFMPVRYAAALRPNEAVQIVRIRLPRRELGQLGLPVGPDEAGDTVRADVLIGEDGLVQAIRFIY